MTAGQDPPPVEVRGLVKRYGDLTAVGGGGGAGPPPPPKRGGAGPPRYG
jgi:hypothetical protein